MARKNVTVLLSGSGTTFAAIQQRAELPEAAFQITDVISDNADAYGLERAQRAGCRTHTVPYRRFETRDQFDAALLETVDACAPDLVVLAGFMRIVAPSFVRAFAGRLLNIHPSLLPRYPGLNTYRRALEAGDEEHGSTVHFVNDVLDGGPLIAQAVVDVRENDTADTLAERVQRAERSLYPTVIDWYSQDRLSLRDNEVWLDGTCLSAPVRGTVDEHTQEFHLHALPA